MDKLEIIPTAHCVLRPQVLQYTVLNDTNAGEKYWGYLYVQTKDGVKVGVFTPEQFDSLFDVVRIPERDRND